MRATAVALLAVLAAASAQAQPAGAKKKTLARPPASDVSTGRVDERLRGVVADASRPEADRARDGARHPVESLAFWGLKPGATVVDLQPGGGYWTYILAPYARATGGRYVAGAGLRGKDAFMTKFGDQAKFGEVGYAEFSKTSAPVVPAGTADLVLSSREIHNWMRGEMLDKGMSDAFAMLKPGGVFAVEEHRADGSAVKTDGSAGYVPTQTVVAAAQKAGFRLAAKSEINANAKDTKDHPFGVWTLPPSRFTTANGQGNDPAFDRTKYEAIGESDRMTLRFEKPRA